MNDRPETTSEAEDPVFCTATFTTSDVGVVELPTTEASATNNNNNEDDDNDWQFFVATTESSTSFDFLYSGSTTTETAAEEEPTTRATTTTPTTTATTTTPIRATSRKCIIRELATKDDEEDEEEEVVDRSLPPPVTKSMSALSLSSYYSQRLGLSSSSTQDLLPLFDDMPSQLHPAVSLGMQRVSSCYFSLGSREDSINDFDELLWSQLGGGGGESGEGYGNQHLDGSSRPSGGIVAAAAAGGQSSAGRCCVSTTTSSSSRRQQHEEEVEIDVVLYHDILMNVFAFLDVTSLARFSETCRRTNFEVFYYLQLQLQQALLPIPITSVVSVDNSSSSNNNNNNNNTNRRDDHHDDLFAVTTSSSLTRLATLDMNKAREVVQEYLNSNSTLRTMPLSYSLAYARYYLMQKNENSSKALAASAALFMTVVGAATLVSSGGGADTTMIAAGLDTLGNELPNVLFRVGFVGSLMGAARQISSSDKNDPRVAVAAAMKETAEQMAHSMKERILPASFRHHGNEDVDVGSAAEPQQEEAEEEEEGGRSESYTNNDRQASQQFRLPSLVEMRQKLQTTLGNLTTTTATKNEEEAGKSMILPNPYDHLPAHREAMAVKEEDAENGSSDDDKQNERELNSKDGNSITASTSSSSSSSSPDRTMPSGCVGAYVKAIHTSSHHLRNLVKETRKTKFQNLSSEDQRQLSLEFLNACTSNESLDLVKDLVYTYDVDGFFPNADNSEISCALHTAAFHGAEKIVDFLCGNVDERNSRNDGGLCDVNIRDNNGWTAVHFAAGTNAVQVVRVLMKHGAILDVEAHNGYSPLQWAVRLSQEEVASELTDLLAAKATTDHGKWIPGQPLSSIANRFLSLIPSH